MNSSYCSICWGLTLFYYQTCVSCYSKLCKDCRAISQMVDSTFGFCNDCVINLCLCKSCRAVAVPIYYMKFYCPDCWTGPPNCTFVSNRLSLCHTCNRKGNLFAGFYKVTIDNPEYCQACYNTLTGYDTINRDYINITKGIQNMNV